VLPGISAMTPVSGISALKSTRRDKLLGGIIIIIRANRYFATAGKRTDE